MLSEFYRLGVYVDEDHEQRIHWLNIAAGEGYAPAQHALALSFLNNMARNGDTERGLRNSGIRSNASPKRTYRNSDRSLDRMIQV